MTHGFFDATIDLFSVDFIKTKILQNQLYLSMTDCCFHSIEIEMQLARLLSQNAITPVANVVTLWDFHIYL